MLKHTKVAQNWNSQLSALEKDYSEQREKEKAISKQFYDSIYYGKHTYEK